MLQLRVFYAMTDSRTPTLIQLFTVAVKIPLLLACPLVLPPREVVLGLAAANGARPSSRAPCSGRCCCGGGWGGSRPADVASTTGRTLVAALVGALAAAGVVALIPWDGLAPLGRAWLQLVVAVVVIGTGRARRSAAAAGARARPPLPTYRTACRPRQSHAAYTLLT